jgi:tRNA(Ile)-lysidine synthase
MAVTGKRPLSLIAAVRGAIQSSRCSRRVVVAVSGGADSTAVLFALNQLAADFELEVSAAHLDHGLRADSAADAAWLTDLCGRLQIPLEIRKVDVAELSMAGSAGIEETARNVRRQFLAATASESGAEWVATGHTADDQVETVLHRILRGSGIRGLAGIRSVAPLAPGVQFIRPLLEVTRDEVEAWLTSQGQTWRVDSTNVDLRHARNRIRHELLPLLRREFNPRVDAALRRLAAQCGDAESDAGVLARWFLDQSLLDCQTNSARLDCAQLGSLPENTLREVAFQLWRRQGWPEQGMSYQHWRRLARLIADGSPASSLSLPGGIQACRAGSLLRLTRSG